MKANKLDGLNILLEQAAVKINDTYSALGHDQGWSFLYTPGRTLCKGAKFLFMGLNPGGTQEAIALTTEAGNAYHPDVEKWRGDDPSPLQLQIVAFYSLLAKKMNYPDARRLMDESLAANFCPFRSRSWVDLKERDKSISFCEELWKELLLSTQITTIVCMSLIVRKHMSSLIVEAGGKLLREDSQRVEWGNVTYSVSQFIIADRNITMVCLPHLSRYRIFGREKSDSATNDIVDAVFSSLGDWRP